MFDSFNSIEHRCIELWRHGGEIQSLFFLAPRRRPIHDRALRRYGVHCELASVAQAADRAKIVCIFLNHENNINQRDSFSNPPKIYITIMFGDDNIYVWNEIIWKTLILRSSIRTILQTHTHRSYTPVAHSVSSPNDRHAYWPTCAMRSTKAESTIAGDVVGSKNELQT